MEPASIRFKNPGAMWGNAIAIKWGADPKPVALHDGKGQGNNIAVFPTYVQGICAQLDLWRTSNYYRNKRFADAIATWSGHNETSSYIAFVKKRVAGLTEDTIMNDDFWKSDMGIAFLKAQAWHEAGKKYPAPDSDWSEAQKRVFAEHPPISYQSELQKVQQRLNKLGFVGKNGKPLATDGVKGENTDFAVREFQRKNQLWVDGIAGPNTLKALKLV